VVNYREAYGMYACNGILFNHESPIRGETFVTRKITRAAGRIKLGLQKELVMGNIDAKRDWGYAPDYTEAMWRILQQETPDDYVCATNETNTVRDFIAHTFRRLDMELAFEGEGVNEVGREVSTGRVLVRIAPAYFRPTEVELLIGDYSKAKKQLGWEPTVRFEELVQIMTDADLCLAQKEARQ
jgi:GDPmannose 4,6-dehydratase